MPIDIEGLSLSEDPIAGLDQDQATWREAPEFPPLPPADNYQLQIKKIREVQKMQTEDGQRLVAVLDFKIVNNPKFEGRSLNFNRVSNAEFVTKDRGRTSFMLDLVKSAGVTMKLANNKDFVAILNEMESNGTVFGGQLDWRGFCVDCYERKLIELTQAPAKDVAKNRATKENKKEAAKFATKFRSYRDFPSVPGNGDKKEIVECPDCGEELRAQGQIQRFFQIK